MFCIPQLSLKERIVKRGLEKDYRAKGINRAIRRGDMITKLSRKQVKIKPMKKADVKFNVIKREERKKDNVFSRIKKIFKLK